MTLTLGSLFDGIGGWQLAAVRAGIQPIWSSEIEAFPIEVTRRHFPDTIQLGDVTKIDGAAIQPVDIICAGSPCQDLSVAGKRAGLAGERSSLFVQAVDIVRQMRRATGGRKPRFFVWENVPGAFSSNRGADFRTVLEEIGQTEIPMPERNKWAQSGVVQCDECEIAWRVLDAQYWGVPQRRKRIFLVADFAAADRRAAEVLFVEPCVPRDTAESQGEGQEAAGNARESVERASICWEMNQPRNRINDYSTKTTSPTLTARMGTGGNQVPIVHSYCIAGNTIDRKPQNGGNGLGYQEGVSYTLNTNDQHAVAQVANFQGFGQYKSGDVASTVKSRDYKDATDLAYEACGTVRRLTPLECERLQGLPDGWTESGSDTARYKAIGNGMAQPCADFILRRIAEEAGDA